MEINGHYPYSNDGSYILLVDLSRGEVIRKMETLRSDLYPVSWCGGTLIFDLQELRNYVDRDIQGCGSAFISSGSGSSILG